MMRQQKNKPLPAVEVSPATADNRKATSGLAAAGNIFACLAVGGALGWGADWLLGTTPWGMLMGIMLGFVAWLRELWQLLQS